MAKPTLTIDATHLDLTPTGKRRAFQHSNGKIHWHVAGRRFRILAPTAANASLTKEWLASISDTTMTMAEYIDHIRHGRLA